MITPIVPSGETEASKSSALQRFFGKFAVLHDAIPELWLVFAIKFISIAAYAVTNTTIVLWLQSDLGFGDKKALRVVAAWSLLMSFVTLLVGSLTDVLGMRRTLFIGTTICIVARFVLVVTGIKWLALGFGLVPLAVGEALGGPVLVAAARKYSNTRQRSMSFSMIYAMMNLGFWISAFLIDHLRKWLGEYGHWSLFGNPISTYRTIFLAGLVLEILLLPLIWMLREGAEASDAGLKIVPRAAKPAGRTMIQSVGLTISEAAKGTWQLVEKLLSQTMFYRLLAFLVLIAFVKLIYRQMDYVYPLFGIRELGPGAPIMTMWGWNSLFVIILVPIIGAMTQRFSAYSMVILGCLISACSVFFMSMPPSMFEPLANGFLGNFIGHTLLGVQGAVHPYYVMITLFVLMLSIGESFYSPRVYEYSAAIAPKGQEASYSALSYIPLLLPKLLIGIFSGNWLEQYCPATGPRHSQTLWLIVALISLVAPVGLIVLRPFIRVHEAGRDDAH